MNDLSLNILECDRCARRAETVLLRFGACLNSRRILPGVDAIELGLA